MHCFWLIALQKRISNLNLDEIFCTLYILCSKMVLLVFLPFFIHQDNNCSKKCTKSLLSAFFGGKSIIFNFFFEVG
jgi:hypothetical protein